MVLRPSFTGSSSAQQATDSHPARFRLPHWGWFLLATAVLFVAGIGLSVWMPYHREQEVIRKIKGWGGEVATQAGGPESLRKLAGEERMTEFKVFDRVSGVSLGGPTITDAEVASVSGLHGLRKLSFKSCPAITDAGLAHLDECRELESLHLIGTPATGVGLPRLTKLSYLSLYDTAATDAGLARLTGLTSLQSLSLSGTAVTDAGLLHLHRLTNLRGLFLSGTAVAETGIEELKADLTDCNIRR